MADEMFYAVVRDNDGSYYAGDGRFTNTVLEAARFFTIEDAQKAADSLNQQGYCAGSCRAKTVWVDFPLLKEEATGVEFKAVRVSATEQLNWYAKFYEDGNLSGSSLEIKGLGKENGYPNLSVQGLNNTFSSARVMPGYRVRAFTDLNYTGQELRLDKDPQFGRANYIPGADGVMEFTYFADSDGFRFNDTISSIYCERE